MRVRVRIRVRVRVRAVGTREVDGVAYRGEQR